MNSIVESLSGLGTRFADFALPMFFQSAALIAVLFVFDLLLRNKVRATYRYAVWMLVLIKLILPPSLALPTSAAYWIPANPKSLYSFPVSLRTLPSVTVAVDIDENPARATLISASDSVKTVPTTQAILFVTWLTNVVVMAIFVFWQMRNVVRMIRQSTESLETAQSILDSCRQQLGIKTRIQVRCAAIASPAICGVFRPVILIPPGLASSLNSLELRSVFLHELAHFKRGDLWVNHAQILLQIFYWYNPLLWLANATIRRAREQATDEMVLVAMGGDAPVYSQALLRVAKMGLNRPFAALGLLGILEPGRGLAQRIMSIANRPFPRTAKIGTGGVTAVLLLALVTLPMACRHRTLPASSSNDRVKASASSDWSNRQLRNLKNSGKILTSFEVDAREAKLVDDPENFDARRDLIMHHWFLNCRVGAKHSSAGAKHILWVIEHHPEFQGGAPVRIDPITDAVSYKKGEALWLDKVKTDPTNTMILRNAADYFTVYDHAIAEDILKKGQVIEPSSSEWPMKLGDLYQLEAIGHSGTTEASKAFAEFEKALSLIVPPDPGSPLVVRLAKTAFAAGDLSQARRYAEELLGPGMKWSGGGNAGEAFFHGNLIMGRIALREGRTEEAKKYLLEAGKTKGSPSLGSFGPNMTLAKELLEKGETDAPLAYFQECQKFWTFDPEKKLDTWTALLKEGQVPDFGGNLVY